MHGVPVAELVNELWDYSMQGKKNDQDGRWHTKGGVHVLVGSLNLK